MVRKHIKLLANQYQNAVNDVDKFTVTVFTQAIHNPEVYVSNPEKLAEYVQQLQQRQVLILAEYLATNYGGLNLKKDNEKQANKMKDSTHAATIRLILRVHWQGILGEEAFTTERFSQEKRQKNTNPVWQKELEHIDVDKDSPELLYNFLTALKNALITAGEPIKTAGDSTLASYLIYIDKLTQLPVFDSIETLNAEIKNGQIVTLNQAAFLKEKGLSVDQQVLKAKKAILKRLNDWGVIEQTEVEALIRALPEWNQAECDLEDKNETPFQAEWKQRKALQHLSNLANVLRTIKHNKTYIEEILDVELELTPKNLQALLLGQQPNLNDNNNNNNNNNVDRVSELYVALSGSEQSFECLKKVLKPMGNEFEKISTAQLMGCIILSGSEALFSRCITEIEGLQNNLDKLKIFQNNFGSVPIDLKALALMSNHVGMFNLVMQYKTLDIGMHKSNNQAVAKRYRTTGIGVYASFSTLLIISVATGGLALPLLCLGGAVLGVGVYAVGGFQGIVLDNHILKQLLQYKSKTLCAWLYELHVLDIEIKEFIKESLDEYEYYNEKTDRTIHYMHAKNLEYQKETLSKAGASLFSALKPKCLKVDRGKTISWENSSLEEFIENKIEKQNLESLRFAVQQVDAFENVTPIVKQLKYFLKIVDTVQCDTDYTPTGNFIEEMNPCLEINTKVSKAVNKIVLKLNRFLEDNPSVSYTDFHRKVDKALVQYFDDAFTQSCDAFSASEELTTQHPVLLSLIQVKRYLLDLETKLLNSQTGRIVCT